MCTTVSENVDTRREANRKQTCWFFGIYLFLLRDKLVACGCEGGHSRSKFSNQRRLCPNFHLQVSACPIIILKYKIMIEKYNKLKNG